MRAIYCSDIKQLNTGQDYLIEGPNAHHLSGVARIRTGENLLLLNGKGLTIQTKVTQVEKRRVQVKVLSCEQLTQSSKIDLAVGITKKEAWDELLKKSVELGIGTLYPLYSQFAQPYKVNPTRSDRLIESALIQSNNPWKLRIEDPITLEQLKSLAESYQSIALMGLQTEQQFSSDKKHDNVLLVVGPEGGFSKEEEEMILSFSNTYTITLPCPILRTPTAVVSGAGFLLGQLLSQRNEQ